MKKTMLMATLVLLGGAAALADTEVVDGITWTYTVSGGTASVGGGSWQSTAVPTMTTGVITIPSILGGKPVTGIAQSAFSSCSGLTKVTIPEGVTSIANEAFSSCSGLTTVTIPSSVTSIGVHAFFSCSGLTSVTIPSGVTSISHWAFYRCSGLKSVTILAEEISMGVDVFYGCSGLKHAQLFGPAPNGLAESLLLQNAAMFSCQRQDGEKCIKIGGGGISKFAGYTHSYLMAQVISTKIRENDPTIMDVVYKVTSKKPTVKVRVLAFEDGVRSFAKVVRPETFVTDTNGVETACNVGDSVTPNVEHTISWRVSSDWQTKLAKVKFEVMACEGELLPLELMTIPASDQYGKMKISWNAISESQWFDALLWLYADKDASLTLSNGSLRNKTNNQELANGVNLSGGYSYYDSNGNWVGNHWEVNSVAPSYIFNKMGYSLLTGAPLTYANSETRLGLSPSGARQYAYKIVEE